MWKPTKVGVYRHGEEIAHVMYPGTISVSNEPAPRYCPDDFDPVATCPDDWRRWQGRLTPVPDGPWSLLAPDWQPGAPTVAQLERWQWWAVVTVGGDLVAGSWSAHVTLAGTLLDVVTSNGRKVDTDAIAQCTPIQPDLSSGPLWVPLEVCK